VRFFRVTEPITLPMDAKEEKQLLRFRKQIKQLDLVVLDELGYVPAGKVGAELLFDVLSTAYDGPQALPDPLILGATAYPRIQSNPSAALFDRPALHFSTGVPTCLYRNGTFRLERG
jgi:hypothetical protein